MFIGSGVDLFVGVGENLRQLWKLKMKCSAVQCLSEAEVIQKPDGLETASARSELSFSQQMFVCSVSSEALSADVKL